LFKIEVEHDHNEIKSNKKQHGIHPMTLEKILDFRALGKLTKINCDEVSESNDFKSRIENLHLRLFFQANVSLNCPNVH
jgi:hypothetical protein